MTHYKNNGTCHILRYMLCLTANGELKRPISKIVPLPMETNVSIESDLTDKEL